MRRFLTIFTILILAFLIFPVKAEEEPFRCDEFIPVGEAFDNTLDFMDEVYQELRDVQESLDLAIKVGNEIVKELYENKDVCDFSACQSVLIDASPALGVVLKLPGLRMPWDVCLPACMPKECVGEPCPDISQHLKTIEMVQGLIAGSYDTIDDLFNETTEIVTADIAGTFKGIEKNAGDEITWIEYAQRKLNLAREWLKPYSGYGKKTAILSKSEREKVETGEMSPRFPMKCQEALKEGSYWPKPWSENCADECKQGLTEEKFEDCKDCLKVLEPGASPLAQINYKIYKTCETECPGELTPDCLECLCTENGKRLSEDECSAWLCGGSLLNWIYCH